MLFYRKQRGSSVALKLRMERRRNSPQRRSRENVMEKDIWKWASLWARHIRKFICLRLWASWGSKEMLGCEKREMCILVVVAENYCCNIHVCVEMDGICNENLRAKDTMNRMDKFFFLYFSHKKNQNITKSQLNSALIYNE